MNPTLPWKSYPRVALWVSRQRKYGRGVLEGIAEYADTYGPWSMFVDLRKNFGRWLKNWRGEGVLAYVGDHVSAQYLARLKIPTVDLLGDPKFKLPRVGNDNHAIGRMAAEHLLERQFKNFGFGGYPDEFWACQRREGFTHALAAVGFQTHQFHSGWPKSLATWERVQQKMRGWLRQLPQPCGLMACSDHYAQLILEACRACDISVPEQIAVIGSDNDEEACRFCDPPLSSVIDDTRQIGYEAARLLHQIMLGKVDVKDVTPILIPPLGIATRRSTDVTAIDDKMVAEATRFIREHACQHLTVADLPKKFGVSRSLFYSRFQKALGRSPHQEILRMQMSRVKNLLIQTRLPLEQIAGLSGFEHPEYLSVVFKRETGTTPGEFRGRHSVTLRP